MSRRPYIRPVSRTAWYMTHVRYKSYMLRELTCVLVAVYCVLILSGLAALASGTQTRWDEFLASQQHLAWILFHGFALVFFTVYQSIAWFGLAPKAMPLQMGDRTVPGGLIVAAHYMLWLVLSAALFWIAGVI
ncbi:MAG TPA: hypothetical protein VKN35_04940 [Xanthomonadales bacterium]|nr:hypothetical protein [Xanthomonadales bacterium]